jgi:uncharacterized protein YqgV (UPF0045/DUF77 family)
VQALISSKVQRRGDLFLLIAAAGLVAPAPDDFEIRSARERSNAAIAAHRYAGVAAELAPDYTVIPGSLGRPLGAVEAAKRMEVGMRDPSFVTYVRTPDRVIVAASRKRAVESGKWVGIWNKSDGEMRLEGVYQATWIPRAGGWKLLNESFVSLTCSGSRRCDEVY